MSRRTANPDTLRATSKAVRRAAKSMRFSTLADVLTRLGEVAEELRTAPDRLAVLKLAEERKALESLADQFAAISEVETMDRLAEQIETDRRERARFDDPGTGVSVIYDSQGDA